MTNVIVPLNAFKKLEVLKNGQASFIKVIAESGAFGVEIRRELLPEKELKLDSIKNEIQKYGLFTVYSAPIELWRENHSLNIKELANVYKEGYDLGAMWVKVSLGHFEKVQSDVLLLKNFLNRHPEMQLLVENDQTRYGGDVKRLKEFFESVTLNDISVKMTFDAGNWFYSNQDVEFALSKLAPYVHYLHLKQVENQDGELVTVPLRNEGNCSWKKVIIKLPSNIMKALEFPIEPKEKTAEYINFIKEFAKESEAVSCKS
jgi:sugar phosphate isomerase/epimerase